MRSETANKPEGEQVDIDSLLAENQSQPDTKTQAIQTSKAIPQAMATTTHQPVQTASTVIVSNARCSGQQRELTDLGNAERLADLFGDELRYCHGKERWYFWDGARWALAKSGELTRYAAEVARSIAMESYLACNSSQTGKVLNHARASQNQPRLKAMIELARDLRPYPVAVDKLDSDPWKFNCLNGTLNLKTGVLEPHDRADLITKLAPVEYDPRASYVEWLQFLRRITGNDKDLIRYMRRMVGYCMTGTCVEHALFVFWGKGANGKSTFFTAIQNMMGEYAVQAPPDLLAARRQGPGHPCDVADLHGSRLAVDSEVAQNMKMDEAKAKRLTGADRIKARHLFKEFFEFDPTFKLAVAVNDKPKVPGDDDAIWRRMHFVPFSVQIPAEEQDKKLSDKLKLQASGILRWALGGCLEWERDGLQPPASVLDATKEYRSEMDAVGTFINDACDVGSGMEIRASKLYESYESWASQSGIDTMSKTMFGKTIKKRGYKVKRGSRGHHIYIGIDSDVLEGGYQQESGINTDPTREVNAEPDPGPLALLPDRYDSHDPLSNFLHSHGYAGSHLELGVSSLRVRYNLWAVDFGDPKYSQEEMITALKERGWTIELNALCEEVIRGVILVLTNSVINHGPKILTLAESWKDNPPDDQEYDWRDLLNV